jgi:hypothetical protein
MERPDGGKHRDNIYKINAGITFPVKLDYSTYVRTTPSTMVKQYAFDAFGPYALTFTAFRATSSLSTRALVCISTLDVLTLQV